MCTGFCAVEVTPSPKFQLYPTIVPSASLLVLVKFAVKPELLDVKLATTPKLYREVAARFKAMTPFLEFLNKPFAPRR